MSDTSGPGPGATPDERTRPRAGKPYPDVPVRADYPAIERRVLEQWQRDGTFEASIERRPAADQYIFYDGPPFANGLPHYGHLLTSYVKDVVPRYQTMKGHRVERRFGWDCHGLPAEMAAEKELGVSGRRAITEYGMGRFNDYCRTSVLRYTKEWEDYVTRMARWVDFENDYKTMDVSYMESVIWAFKQLWDKGLVYEAFRVMPYSWGAETPLSNFEIRLDDATRPRQDPAITVAFTLDPRPGDPGPMKVLVWTTTPWTLPSNLALAVGVDLDYAVFFEPASAGHARPDHPAGLAEGGDGTAEGREGTYYVVGEGTLERYEPQVRDLVRHGTIKGSELLERTYQPLFPYFADNPDSFRVLAGDFIDVAEGTGVVHMAPGFGEDDQRVCGANGISLVVPVDDEGRFTEEVVDFAGRNVFDANSDVIRWLRDRGALVRHDTYTHNYPHCWRTDTPIIYKALSSWYVQVTAFRDRMVELNQQINWIPGHVRDGAFGRWLEGARDWSISRNRFWGAPIPVWRSDDPAYPRIDVYGSIAELEADFGVEVTDLHRPFVDQLTRPNPDDPTGKSTMRRVPEVLDCWFESGSMPFAQAHYPFENKAWVDAHTADFIVEYIAQTRGWFYTMHVLSVALFDRPAFQNCICHGVVLDEDGRKQSKRLRNYPDPEDVFESIGSDALRWFLMSSPILRGGDLRIDREGSGFQDIVRLVLNPIWNTWHFLALYANVDGYRGHWRTDSTQLLDRYILAKTRQLVEDVTAALDAYELAAACAHVTAFLDALTNWYVRRSRDRFWAPGSAGTGPQSDDKLAAYDTLYTVLHALTRVTAPLLPYLSEEVYEGLTAPEGQTGADRSVHVADWPAPDTLPADPDLVSAMDRVREVCSAALSLREANGLRVRLPLGRLTVAGPAAAAVAPFVDLITDELNVKSVELLGDAASIATFRVQPHGRVLGPKLGPDFQRVRKAAAAGDWELGTEEAGTSGTVAVAGHTLGADEFELVVEVGEGEATAALRGNDTVVNLDLVVTPELRREGQARDLVRLVQQARKEAGFQVTDRIALTVHAPDELAAAFRAHERTIAEAVLAPAGVALAEHGQAHIGLIDGSSVSFTIDRTPG
ncbi:MAG: isoleucine--tRNA ligase [Acidimicrobiia bacterium]|nr:isoleucine--tRNA ligase [Acidimicrobiia bacterium]